MSASRASEPRPSGRPSGDDGHAGRRAEDSSRTGACARGDRVLQSGDLPCVWMTAGLLAWRLCDREYDCEHCPLDAALGGEHVPVDPDGELRERRRPLEFPSDRRYSSTHGWVQAGENGCVRVGLDALVARLLDRISAVVLPAAGSHTQRGQPLCWLVDDGVPVPLASPAAGTVLRTNGRVQADPGLLASSPYDEGWLLELEAGPALEGRKDLTDAAGQRLTTARQLRSVRGRRARLVQRAAAEVGPTLCDGGLAVRDARQLMGTPAYHRLVRRLLR